MGSLKRDRRIATHPRNPWERERLVKELSLMGIHGLKNKKELWTVLTQVREDKKQARTLLITTDEKVVIMQGRELLDRLIVMGLISGVDFNDIEDIRRGLREILNFDLSHYLERRLQYQVYKTGLAKDVHQARCMIYRKQICVRGKVIDVPSFIVKSEDQGLIEVNPMVALRMKRKGNDEPQEE